MLVNFIRNWFINQDILIPRNVLWNNIFNIAEYNEIYNTSSQGGSKNADFNVDGKADGEDYVILLNNYGT